MFLCNRDQYGGSAQKLIHIMLALLSFWSPYTEVHAKNASLLADYPSHISADVAINDSELYLVDSGAASDLRVVNLTTGTVSKRFKGVSAYDLLVAADVNHVYLGLKDKLAVFDLERGSITTTIAIPGPFKMVASKNGRYIYTASSTERRVDIIDTHTNTLVKTIIEHDDIRRKCGNDQYYDGFMDLALSPDEKKLYLADPTNRSIAILDLTSYELRLNVVRTRYCSLSLAVSREYNRLYIGEFFDHLVDVLDTTSNKIVDTIQAGLYPRDLIVSANDKKAYFVNTFDGNVTIVDVSDNRIIKTVGRRFSNPWAGVSARNGHVVYILNNTTMFDVITVISTQTNAVVKTIAAK